MVDGGGDGGGGGYTTRWEVRQSLSTGMPYYLDTTTVSLHSFFFHPLVSTPQSPTHLLIPHTPHLSPPLFFLTTLLTQGATQWEQPKNLWEMVKKVVVEEDIVGVGEEGEERGNAGEEIHPPSFATAASAPTELPNYGIAGTAPPPTPLILIHCCRSCCHRHSHSHCLRCQEAPPTPHP